MSGRSEATEHGIRFIDEQIDMGGTKNEHDSGNDC